MINQEEPSMSRMENEVLEAATQKIDTRNRKRRKRLFIVLAGVVL